MLIFKRFKRAIPLPLSPYSYVPTPTYLYTPVNEMVEKKESYQIRYIHTGPPSTKKMAIRAEVILLAANRPFWISHT